MKKILTLICLLFVSMTLVGCGLGGGDVVNIESVTKKDTDEGVEVTITYVDDIQDPFVFTIPKGEDGKSIEDVTWEVNEENNTTVVTFIFEDPEMPPYNIEIPNGRYVASVSHSYNEDNGNTIIQFKLSDNTLSDEIIIKKGDTGDNGLSIVHVEPKLSSDFQSVEFTFYFSRDPEADPTAEDFEEKVAFTKKITVPILQGVSVESIESIYDPETYKYALKIKMSNQDEGIIYEFERMNTIIIDKTVPMSDQGIDGDIYFATSNKVMYRKVNGTWYQWYSFDAEVPTYLVSLYLNDDPESPANLEGKSEFIIKEGRYFASQNLTLHEPTREGYKFVGWYTSLNPNFKTTQAFTDMTPVYSNMSLFAIWEAIE